MNLSCVEIRISGTVQGVGFRPFVYRTAVRRGIEGIVRNSSDGVYIQAQGSQPAMEEFIEELKTGAPPLARITSFAASSVIFLPL